MKRFKKILFVNNDKTSVKTALDMAVKLAKTNKALLTIVEAAEKFPDERKMGIATPNLRILQEMVLEEIRKSAEDLIESLKKQSVKVAGKTLLGTSWMEIIREVLRNDHDLVMITPRKKAKFKEMLFGTRTMHLMRKCPCPVWAIKPTSSKQYTRILAAVDAVPEENKETLLNRKIMELATSLARSERKSELHIVHCVQQFFEKRIRGRTILNQEEADILNSETRNIHQQWLTNLTEKFNLRKIKHKIHLLAGEPDELIPELVNKNSIDIVVMGTVSRTGLSGFFIGNTAEKMLQELDCSVLAVKPDGFVTPVTLD